VCVCMRVHMRSDAMAKRFEVHTIKESSVTPVCVCVRVCERKIERMCMCECVCVHVCSDAMAKTFEVHSIKRSSVTPVCVCVFAR